jgi:hypothetical protein
MYYPSSQIKTNLYTNGGEYIISTTKENYIGYFYELSNGKKYTGKSTNDKPNILLEKNNIIFNPSEPSHPSNTGVDQSIATIGDYPTSLKSRERLLPTPNPTKPTQKDYDLGAFQRYFCKKNNELIYIEVDKKTYNLFQIQSPTAAWDLYSPLYTMWYIKGNKDQTYKANKNLISLIEQKEKWYGFSQYFKEDYLKYYLAS